MPVIDGNGNYILLEGVFQEYPSLSAGALNEDLVPKTDMSQYNWFSLQIGGTWVGELDFQGSNDGSTWVSTNFTQIGLNVQLLLSTTINGLFYGSKAFRYLRVRMTSYTSGTATGTLEAYNAAPSIVTVGGNVSLLYNGNQRAAVAAGSGTANVALKAFGPGYVSGALVTATGSANLLIYDNPSAASGVVIGIIPSTATVGQYYPFNMVAYDGITAAQVNGSPAVTVGFL
jgi:hypothetical protein